jgi:Family of unknown function (DUF6263)
MRPRLRLMAGRGKCRSRRRCQSDEAKLKSVLTPMIGASFTLVMASTGEVQRVEGLSAVAESAAQDPATAGALDRLKANFSDESMRSPCRSA